MTNNPEPTERDELIEKLRSAYSTVFERSLAKTAADLLEADAAEIARLTEELAYLREIAQMEIGHD